MRVAVRFAGQRFEALGAGALWWPARATLLIADLHLGRPERLARRGGPLLPPFADRATIEKLEAAVVETRPERVISLGDAFDDAAGVEGLLAEDAARLGALAGGREWIWVAGNHEGAVTPGFGIAVEELCEAGIALRHISGQGPDISGHYHPKARLAGRARAAFLVGREHLILPAFGAYTGGMDWPSDPLCSLVPRGIGVLCGEVARAFPLGV